jgi:hypothetical protein
VVLRELAVVLNGLNTHESNSAGDYRIHQNLKPSPVPLLQRDPGEDDAHTGSNQDQSVEKAQPDIPFVDVEPPWPWIIDPFLNTETKKDITGKQTAKKHYLRGKEKPDSQLRVVQPCIAAGGYFVGNLHSKNLNLLVGKYAADS